MSGTVEPELAAVVVVSGDAAAVLAVVAALVDGDVIDAAVVAALVATIVDCEAALVGI